MSAIPTVAFVPISVNLDLEMSVADVRITIDRMSDEDRFFARAYLHQLAQCERREYRDRLAMRVEKIGAGNHVTREQLLKAHTSLEQEGL